MDKRTEQIARRIILESMRALGVSKPVYSMFSDKQFPYGNAAVKSPENINPKVDYIFDKFSQSNTNDTYDFPIEEFKRGLQIEKNRNNKLSFFDIASKVIENIKNNKNFYSEKR